MSIYFIDKETETQRRGEGLRVGDPSWEGHQNMRLEENNDSNFVYPASISPFLIAHPLLHHHMQS